MSSCFACSGRASSNESEYGLENFAYPICRSCQDYIRSNANETTTRQTVWLWIELQSSGPRHFPGVELSVSADIDHETWH
ncbi:MAG: hypothetical protein O2947_08185, partial [Bacteroidetes bacterium]|nr:hypothetical protein [Bacteroidota bacterium]